MATRGFLKVTILGGGAAGFFSALNIAEKNPRADITILEASQNPLQKVRISGGGRCNVTHHCFDPCLLSQYYPRGNRELRSVFSRFQPADMVTWLQERGLKLKAEPDGRMFPVTDQSDSVIELFTRRAGMLGVRLETRVQAERIEKTGTGFALHLKNRPPLATDVLVLATGYSPPGWKLAESLGHTVLPPVPSLFPFKIQHPVIAGLQGISVQAMRGRLKAQGETFEAEGDLLITHQGLSGPLIYRLSALGARALSQAAYQGDLFLDFIPGQSEDALRERLNQLFLKEEAGRLIKNTHFAPLAHRLWLSLLEASGADLEGRGEVIGKKVINRLIEHLKRLPLSVTGRNPSKEEFVSCGGVSLKEVDFKTMQSRRVPNLYFAGEILDIDGLTGGFNFQACWSEAWVLGEALKNQ